MRYDLPIGQKGERENFLIIILHIIHSVGLYVLKKIKNHVEYFQLYNSPHAIFKIQYVLYIIK